MMLSNDYKERFKAEYNQLVIRSNKLGVFIAKIEENPEIRHDCPKELLMSQYEAMDMYLRRLKTRAKYEGIEL